MKSFDKSIECVILSNIFLNLRGFLWKLKYILLGTQIQNKDMK